MIRRAQGGFIPKYHNLVERLEGWTHPGLLIAVPTFGLSGNVTSGWSDFSPGHFGH